MAAPSRTAQLLENVSLHAVWWRPNWVVSWGDPLDFEERRPWTHRIVPQVTFPAAIVAMVAGALGLGALAPEVLIAYMPAAGAVTTGGAIAITRAELRFHAWARGNDDRRLHDHLLPPTHLHPAIADNPDGIEAVRAITGSRKLLERYVRMHSAKLRGWRRYGMPRPWLRVTEIAPPEPVEQFIDAVTAFREANNAVGEQGLWDAEFTAIDRGSKRTGVFDKRLARREQDAGAKLIADVLATSRTLRLALDDAPVEGMTRVSGTAVEVKKPAPVDHYSGGPSPFLAVGAVVVGITLSGIGVLQIPAWIDAAKQAEEMSKPGIHQECVDRGLTIEECAVVHE